MPAKIDVERQPMRPGETRFFTAYGSGPLAVDVKCWVTNLPPPDFRPCAACGSQKMKNGDRGKISAPLDFAGCSIQISVEDAEGDRAVAKISVERTQQRGKDQ